MNSPAADPASDPRSNLVVEQMDSDDLSLGQTARALDDLDRTHRWLMGHLSIEKELNSVLDRSSRRKEPSTLLDVGSGSGALAMLLANRHGPLLSVVVLDRKLSHLVHGRQRMLGESQKDSSVPAPQAVVASALDLPFRDGTFDITLSNLLLHHFNTASAQRHLEELSRTRRRAAIVVDLRPSRLGALGLRLAGGLLGLGAVALEDGLTSFGQSWSGSELRRLTAGLPGVSIRRRFPFRHSIVF